MIGYRLEAVHLEFIHADLLYWHKKVYVKQKSEARIKPETPD